MRKIVNSSSGHLKTWTASKVLSNGQVAKFWVNYFSQQHGRGGPIYVHHEIAICVADSPKEANDWCAGKRSNLNNRSTGRCGLESARFFTAELAEFMRRAERDSETWYVSVVAIPADEKRKRAYSSILVKHGFAWDEEYSCFLWRK